MFDRFTTRRAVTVAVAAVVAQFPTSAFAGTSSNSTPTPAFPGQNDSPAGTRNPAVTISMSGSTAMRNFTVSAGITYLTPGSVLSLNNGAIANPGAPVHLQTRAPVNYTVNDLPDTQFQFASPNFSVGDYYRTGVGSPDVNGPWPQANQPIQQHSAVRFEWHEQGSVEGILELVNDQIGTVGSVTATNRNPSGSGFTPVWINTNQWSAAAAVARPQSGTAFNGQVLNEFYATPGATSGIAQFDNRDGVGVNPFGGQNAVQMAISDVNARQGFSVTGAQGAFNATPGTAGFGKGNAALGLVASKISGAGLANARQSLEDQSGLNMTTAMRNQRTGTSSQSPVGVDGAANFTAGPWNTAGTGNLDNTTIAITATLLVANPGTGLERVNRTDSQWLQAAGRLKNGADFNVATRDVNSGTRNVAALNVGLDPSFAMGELDNGNNGSTSSAENLIGSGIKFSGKLSGSSALRPTVQNSRMAFGHLSISDGVSFTNNGSSQPIRGLDIANTDDTNPSPTFVRASAKNIVDGTYPLFQNQTYVSVKKPSAAFAGDTVAAWSAREDSETGIQGDNSGNDVRDFRQNITDSVAQFPQVTPETAADELIRRSFIIPQLMAKGKSVDGGVVSDNPTYDAVRSGQFLSSESLTTPFAVGGNVPGSPGEQVNTGAVTNNPANVDAGTGSRYGARTGTGEILITQNNYFFGDFNRSGAAQEVRDFSDLDSARRAQSALQGSGSNSMFTTGTTLNGTNSNAVSNATFTEIGFAPTRGDLIVMGDFDSDGDFDGEDIRRMARGTSLADSTSSTTLSGGAAAFADRIRSGKLRKNAALDQLHTGGLQASAQQKIDARAVVRTQPGNARPAGTTLISSAGTGGTLVETYTYDAAGNNAFNKFDVNRDGTLSRLDAQLVDYFVGKDYTNLDHQLDAVARVKATGELMAFVDEFGNPLDPKSSTNDAINRVPLSLVDVELNDTGDITVPGDFASIRTALGGSLLAGDTDFDGDVDDSDFSRLVSNFGLSGKWSTGDANASGAIDDSDFSLLVSNFGTSTGSSLLFAGADWTAVQSFGESIGVDVSAIPEPGSLAVVSIASLGLLARRRRAGSGRN